MVDEIVLFCKSLKFRQGALYFLLLFFLLNLIDLSLQLCLIIPGLLFIGLVLYHFFLGKKGESKPYNSENYIAPQRIGNSFLGFGLFIQLFPLLAGISFAIRGAHIQEMTQGFLKLNYNGDLDLFVCMFWILFAIWTYLFPIYLGEGEKTNTRRLNEIIRAVHKSPDIELMRSYPKSMRLLKSQLREIDEKEDVFELEKLVTSISILLKGIVEIVKYFSPHSDIKEEIGANIWIVISKNDQPELFEILPETLTFNTTCKGNKIKGALVLTQDLILDNDQPNFTYTDLLILPIPENAENTRYKIALPGSPWAALTGMSIYNNLDSLEHDLIDMSADTRESVLQYFGDNGAGKDIESFASFRIGTGSDPIGVISMDSRHDDLMGDRQFLDTFLALIEPIKLEIGDRVRRYAQIMVENKTLILSKSSEEE